MNNKFFLLAMLSFIFIIIFSACAELTNSFVKETEMINQIPVKYLYNDNPFYIYWKKHICPKCGEKLKTAYDSIIINSASPEAKNYDFSTAAGDYYLTGDVEFRTCYFKCPICEYEISFDHMRKYEKEKQ